MEQLITRRTQNIAVLLCLGVFGFFTCWFLTSLSFTDDRGAVTHSLGEIVGSIVGGAIGSFGAAFAVILTFVQQRQLENEKRARELEQTKRAIWQDLRATLKVVFLEYECWLGPYLLLESIKNGSVEHLRPTVFDANLKRLGELDPGQALRLLLVHDNLRAVREWIAKFEFDRTLAPDFSDQNFAAKQKTYGRIVEEALDESDEIRGLLFSICIDSKAALDSLDPNGLYESDVVAVLQSRLPPEDDPKWLSRLRRALDDATMAF